LRKQMKDIWVISDTHFNHENFLKFTNKDGSKIRPFNNVNEVDELMINNWNSVVKPQDKVYHLGDVYFGNQQRAIEIMSKLNGHKRLILGNHDNGKDSVLSKYFEKIDVWRMFPEFGLLFTHIPVHKSTLKVFVAEGDYKEGDCGPVQKSFVNVHGHIHQNPSPDGPYKCVCVEQINYTPIHIEELRVK
jgi:calcineurin-like phosphoesterase family protein